MGNDLEKPRQIGVYATKSSVSFKMAAVREMGHTCLLRYSQGFCLGNRTTSRLRGGGGSLCWLQLDARTAVIGCTRTSAYSLGKLGTLSGLVALCGFRCFRAVRTAGSNRGET